MPSALLNSKSPKNPLNVLENGSIVSGDIFSRIGRSIAPFPIMHICPFDHECKKAGILGKIRQNKALHQRQFPIFKTNRNDNYKCNQNHRPLHLIEARCEKARMLRISPRVVSWRLLNTFVFCTIHSLLDRRVLGLVLQSICNRECLMPHLICAIVSNTKQKES